MAVEQYTNAAASTLHAGINSVVGSLTVNSAVGFPTQGNFRILIDTEILLVTAVAGNVFTVSRAAEAYNGSAVAAAHLAGAAVTHVLTAAGALGVLGIGQPVANRSVNGVLFVSSTGLLAEDIGNGFGSDFTYDGSFHALRVSTIIASGSLASPNIQISTVYGTPLFEMTIQFQSGSGTIVTATNTAPVVCNSPAHGLLTGASISVTFALGLTSINADWSVTVIDVDNFSLDTSDGTTGGAYVGNSGTWGSNNGTWYWQNSTQPGPGNAVIQLAASFMDATGGGMVLQFPTTGGGNPPLFNIFFGLSSVFLVDSTGLVTATGGFVVGNTVLTTTTIATSGTVAGTNINPAAFGLTYANPLSVDITKGDVFTVTTTNGVGNATFNASASGAASRTITFVITNDAGGARTITFGTHFKPAATLVGTQSKTATITFRSDGTNWWEIGRVTGIT